MLVFKAHFLSSLLTTYGMIYMYSIFIYYNTNKQALLNRMKCGNPHYSIKELIDRKPQNQEI